MANESDTASYHLDSVLQARMEKLTALKDLATEVVAADLVQEAGSQSDDH